MAESPDVSSWLTADDMNDLAAGAALMGSGGGGETLNPAMMVKHELAEHGPVPLLPLSALAPTDLMVSVAAIGSGVVLVESFPHGNEFVAALDAMHDHLRRNVAALVPLEIGGLNAIFAVMAASRNKLPLVDADAMGRAFPRLTQTTLAAAGIPTAPMVIANSLGASLLIRQGTDDTTIASLVQGIVPALGGWGAMACFPGRVDDYTGAVILGSVSTACRLGSAFRNAQSNSAARSGFLRDHNVSLVGGGTVLQVAREGMFLGAQSTFTIAHRDDPDRTLRVDAADEYLLVFDDGEPVAVTPQPICVLDERTWQPIGPDQLVEHQQIEIIALPVAQEWQTATRPATLSSYDMYELPGNHHGNAKS